MSYRKDIQKLPIKTKKCFLNARTLLKKKKKNVKIKSKIISNTDDITY